MDRLPGKPPPSSNGVHRSPQTGLPQEKSPDLRPNARPHDLRMSQSQTTSDPNQEQNPHVVQWMMAAHLLRPQGRRGEILAEPSAPFELFTPGRRLARSALVTAPAQPLTLVEIESAWQPTGRNAGRLVLKLQGTDSITAAEALAGQHLFLRVDELPALEEGTYRVRDLTGCALFDGDVLVGTVLDLQFAVGADGRTRLEDAPDLLVVQPVLASESESSGPEAEPVLVPFVRAWLLEVDLPAKRIRMQLPPGLFDDVE